MKSTEREQLEGCYEPVRRANLFNIAAGLFETRRQVWAKAINLQKEAKLLLILINVARYRETEQRRARLTCASSAGESSNRTNCGNIVEPGLTQQRFGCRHDEKTKQKMTYPLNDKGSIAVRAE